MPSKNRGERFATVQIRRTVHDRAKRIGVYTNQSVGQVLNSILLQALPGAEKVVYDRLESGVYTAQKPLSEL